MCYIVSYSAVQLRLVCHLVNLGDFGCVFIYQNNEFIELNFTHLIMSMKPA